MRANKTRARCKNVWVPFISPGGTRVCAVGQPTHPRTTAGSWRRKTHPEGHLGQDRVALGDMTAHSRRHRDDYYKYYGEEKGL